MDFFYFVDKNAVYYGMSGRRSQSEDRFSVSNFLAFQYIWQKCLLDIMPDIGHINSISGFSVFWLMCEIWPYLILGYILLPRTTVNLPWFCFLKGNSYQSLCACRSLPKKGKIE